MYGYTPPQEYVDPFVEENTATTFLFSNKGLGKREKRENWIWRSHSVRQTHPEPFSYEYVMEDGHLPGLAVVRPSNDDKAAAGLPRRTRSTKKVTFSDRHSSPIDTKRSLLVPPETILVKRSKSVSAPSTRPSSSSSDLETYNTKPLPLLPKPTTKTHARASLERTVSDFDIQFAQWGLSRDDPLRPNLAQQLRERRPSPAGSADITPTPSPAHSIHVSPRRSFEEPRQAPPPPPPKHHDAEMMHGTPPRTPTGPLTLQHAAEPEPATKPLKRRPSKFIEHLDDKLTPRKVDVTEPLPRHPLKVTLPALLPSPEITPRSSLERHRRVDSVLAADAWKADEARKVEIWPTPLILQAGLPSPYDTHQQHYGHPHGHQRFHMPDTPPLSPEGSFASSATYVTAPEPAAAEDEEDFTMSGALAPLPTKPLPSPMSMFSTPRTAGGKTVPASVFVGKVCTAEVRPVLRSPVVAHGCARLVVC